MKTTWNEIYDMFNTDYARNWYNDMPEEHKKESFEDLTKEEIEAEITGYEDERDNGIYTIIGDADPEYFEAIDEILEKLKEMLAELQ